MVTNKKMFVSLMFIALISILAAGCSDDNTTTVAPAIDTTPPGVPYNLVGNYNAQLSSVLVSWGVNSVDTDLAGYVLQRAADGIYVDLVEEPAMIQSFQDFSPADGAATYNVFAVDFSGNASAVASISVNKEAHQGADYLSKP